MKLLKLFKVGGACGGFKCQPKPEACAELLKKVMSLVGAWHFKSRQKISGKLGIIPRNAIWKTLQEYRSFSEWETIGFPYIMFVEFSPGYYKILEIIINHPPFIDDSPIETSI